MPANFDDISCSLEFDSDILKLESTINHAEVTMQTLLLILSFIFLGIIAPVFLLTMVSPGSFATILAGWTIFATISLLFLWVFLKRKRQV